MKERQAMFAGSVREILAGAVQDEELNELLGALGVERTMLNGIHLALCLKALKGDVQAAKYLRETAEENNDEEQELSLDAMDLTSLSDRQLRAMAEQRMIRREEGGNE